VSYQWLILASLAVVAGFITVKIPGIKIKLSLADIFVFANTILFGPAAGCISAALEAFSGSIRCITRARRSEFIMFNTGNVATYAHLSWLVYCLVQGRGLCYANIIRVG